MYSHRHPAPRRPGSRSWLLAVLAIGVLASSSPAFARIPGKGLYDLARYLLHRNDANLSRNIRLIDKQDRLGASLRLGLGPRGEWAALVTIDDLPDPLYVHALEIRGEDGRTIRPKIARMEPEQSGGRGELVVAEIAPADLDWMVSRQRLELQLVGFDATLDATIDDKGVRKMRELRDRHPTPGPKDPVPPRH